MHLIILISFITAALRKSSRIKNKKSGVKTTTSKTNPAITPNDSKETNKKPDGSKDLIQAQLKKEEETTVYDSIEFKVIAAVLCFMGMFLVGIIIGVFNKFSFLEILGAALGMGIIGVFMGIFIGSVFYEVFAQNNDM